MSFIFANDAAMGTLGYARNDLDHYPTPDWVTEAVCPVLLRLIDRDIPVWEPCCGTGVMAEVLKRHFATVRSTDIRNYGYTDQIETVDFLTCQDAPTVATLIITNPPYGDLAERVIRQALALTHHASGLVAMLLRHEYDTARGRVDLFNQPPFAARLTLTTRPRWIEGTTGAPRHSYAWFIWSWSWVTAPMVLYS